MARNRSDYPKTILFLNEKGGCGKTTILDECAFICDLHGVPYSVTDLDGQGGLLHKPVQNPNAKLHFIDTPGKLLRNVDELIRDADVVVVPTLMDQKNLETAERMVELTEPWRLDGKPVIFIMNQYDGGIAAEHFCEAWASEFPKIPYLMLSRSVLYKNAAEEGIGVVHKYAAKPRRELWTVFWTIMKELGEYDNILRIMQAHDDLDSRDKIEAKRKAGKKAKE